MRLLFELLLFLVLAFFFGAVALVFYKWLSKKFLSSERAQAPHQDIPITPSNDKKEDAHG